MKCGRNRHYDTPVETFVHFVLEGFNVVLKRNEPLPPRAGYDQGDAETIWTWFLSVLFERSAYLRHRPVAELRMEEEGYVGVLVEGGCLQT